VKRPAEAGAEQRPETDHKDHRHFLAEDIVRAPESIRPARGGDLEVQVQASRTNLLTGTAMNTWGHLVRVLERVGDLERPDAEFGRASPHDVQLASSGRLRYSRGPPGAA
jgi:hypothetical protein